VDLKHRLRNIQTNRANLAHGRLPSMWFGLTQPPYGTSMPQSGRRPQHHKQTLAHVRVTSGFTPESGHRPSVFGISVKGQKPPSASFDHLVGTREQVLRDVEAQRLGSLDINDQFVLRGK